MSWDEVLEDTDWQQYAECKDLSNKIFFGEGIQGRSRDELERRKLALRVCAMCSVQEECIMYSLRSPTDYLYRDPRNINNHLRENVVLDGIWGGLDSFQRVALMRRMKHARVPNIGKPRKFQEELKELELRRNKKNLRLKRKAGEDDPDGDYSDDI